MFGLLAGALIEEGDTLKAREVLYKCLDVIPESKILHNYYSLDLVKGFYAAGEKEKAMSIATGMINNAREYLEMVTRLNKARRYDLDYVISLNIQSLISLYNMSASMGIEELMDLIEQDLDRYYNELFMQP